MHTLSRSVRFSINPFLDADVVGSNGFASNPAGTGLALFLELAVELRGPLDPETGFVRNVIDIDAAVRACGVPLFTDVVRRHWRSRNHITFETLAQVLVRLWARLDDGSAPGNVARLSLRLNPFRTLAIDSPEALMVYFSEKFEFAAMHKLWNDALSEQRNLEVFGKCANPAGHGHNYTVEVTVKAHDPAAIDVGRFERIVDTRLIELLDHKNLNADVPDFASTVPSIENLAVFAWDRLKDAFETVQLHAVTVGETDRTHCSYYG